MPVEDELERASDVTHLLCREWRLPLHVGVTTRLKQAVAFPKRNLQRLSEHEQRLPTRLRPARFDEAQMARRESRMHRQIELAHSACGSPIAQQLPDCAAELVIMPWRYPA